jgi:hypothetical protein
MKKLVLFIAFIVFASCVQAQKVYFIYIQSENASPFFVKMNDKIRSSTGAGYVILSSLKDSTYNFSIGFPGKQEEHKFSVTINKEDRGFLLKNADNAWGLFDLQTLTFYKSIAGTKETILNIPDLMAQADPFTRLLSQAADDPSLLVSGPNPAETKPLSSVAKSDAKPVSDQASPANEPIAQQEVKTADTSAIVNKITAAATPDSVVTALHVETTINPQAGTTVIAADSGALQNATGVTVNNQSTKDTVAIVAISSNKTTLSADTVNAVAVAPAENKLNEQVANNAVQGDTAATVVQTQEAVYEKSVVTRRSESSTTEGFGLVFLDNQGNLTDTIRLLIPNPRITGRIQPAQVKNEELTPAQEVVAEPSTSLAGAVVNTETKKDVAVITCAEQANEKDFRTVRKAMAAEENDSDMINVAIKSFGEKCFTTEQVKNLSALFLTPSGKFDFFKAAYNHTSDKDVFAALQSEIRDDYYAGRFKDLVGGR